MSTCRCSMCGAKNAGKNKNKGLYLRFDIGTSERKHSFCKAKNKKEASRLLRTRMKRELRKMEV